MAAALTNRPSVADIVIMIWNVCWLVDRTTEAANAKKRRIEEALVKGHIVLLQETHWLDADARLWLLSLLVRHSYYSEACDDRVETAECLHHGRSGRMGGVAILLLCTGSYAVI